MGLGYQFKKARKTVENLTPEDRCALEKICRDIQQAQKDLLEAAADALETCRTACRGICCRNVNLDAVMGYPDFAYILTMESGLAGRMAACLENESLFFVSDCIFLENGTGPCIFPRTLMPEVCITTFCSDETPAKKEIKQLKWNFFHLSWFLGTLKVRAFTRFMAGLVKNNRISKRV